MKGHNEQGRDVGLVGILRHIVGSERSDAADAQLGLTLCFVAGAVNAGGHPGPNRLSKMRFRRIERLHLRGWLDAAIILDIVKADADFADMPGWIVCCPEADQRVHLIHDAFSTVSQYKPDLAVPHPSFELVEQKQGLPIYIDVDAAIAVAISAQQRLAYPAADDGTLPAIRR